MRKERKIINTNIRLNLCDEQDRQAWEYLQTTDRQKYKSRSRKRSAASGEIKKDTVQGDNISLICYPA